MTVQDQTSCSYRYHEMAGIIVSSIVRSAFIASRYTAEPAESTKSYYSRVRLALYHIENKYLNQVADAIERMVVAPESNNDLYEAAYASLDGLLNSMAKEVADPAYQLDINKINEYFTNEN